MNEGQEDYYERRRQYRDDYPALPFRGQQSNPKRRSNNQKKQFESYLPPRRQSAQIRELLKTSEPIHNFQVVQPIPQNEAEIPENRPSLKDNLKDGTPSDNASNNNLNASTAVLEAGPSHPQEPDPREEETRKLNLRTGSWSVREFLDLVKYSRDITLSLCYVLAAPVDLQFPDCHRFGPTVEPIFKAPADIINTWRFTKSTTCILVGANVCNTIIELFSLFWNPHIRRFTVDNSESHRSANERT